MSYGEFTRELSREFGKVQSETKSPTVEDFDRATHRVIDRWIVEGRHEDLIAYMIENFDSIEGGDDEIRHLATELVKIGRADWLRKLYGPIVQCRCDHFFDRRALLAPHRLIPAPIRRALIRYSPQQRELERRKREVLAFMGEFRTYANAIPGASVSEIDRRIAAFEAGQDFEPRTVPIAADRMDEDVFWTLVSDACVASDTYQDAAAVIEASLAALKPSEIKQFQAILSRLLNRTYKWELWAVAYAERGGCSDDAFDYFREWLVLQGREVFERATADPLAWALDPAFAGTGQCETLSNAAPTAYQARTGKKMPAIASERPQEPSGTPWSEGDFAQSFPALAERFGV